MTAMTCSRMEAIAEEFEAADEVGAASEPRRNRKPHDRMARRKRRVGLGMKARNRNRSVLHRMPSARSPASM